MKIIIVSAYNIGNETGTAKVSERLSNYLSKNHEVLYICLGKTYRLEKAKTNLTYLKIPSVCISDLYIPKITPKIVKKIKSDLTKFSPDIIHSQNIVFSALIALIWARENNVPFVVTFHSLPSEGIRYVFPKLKKDKVISKIDYSLSTGYVQRFLDQTDLVIALNAAVVNSVNKIKSKTPMVIMNNGLVLDDFNKLKTKPPTKTVNFLYLGSYTARKNQEFLINAFKYLPNNYKLNLYGNLKSGQIYVKKLKKIVSKSNIKNVKIHGFLDQKGVLKAYEKANYFVSASIKEAQSLVIVEALASGTPVIALQNETIDELINKRNGLSLPQKTKPKRFAKELRKYVESTSPKYSQISTSCKKSVERFDIALVTKKLIRKYQSVIKNKDRQKHVRKNNIYNQLYKLIPKQASVLFDEKMVAKINKSKPSFLKLLLSATVIFSVLFTGIAYILTVLRGKKKG